MEKLNCVCFPKTVKETVAVLNKRPGAAMALAGGTLLARAVPPGVECLADIRNLPLKNISSGGKWLRIGPACTFTDMAESEVVKKWADGIMADASLSVSSRHIRNMATVGGNVVKPIAFNSLPPVFLALDAVGTIAGKNATKAWPLAEVMTPAMSRELGRRFLLVDIKIPAETRKWSGAFEKFSKIDSEWDCYVIAAVLLDMRGGVCKTARIALGAVLPRAQRFAGAEKLLEGGTIDETAAIQAAKSVADELVKTAPGLKPYRREVAEVVVRRCILKAARMEKDSPQRAQS